MKTFLRWLLAIAIVIVFAILCIKLQQENRVVKAYRELTLTVSSVQAITLYDVNATRSFSTNISSIELSSKISAPFPLEVFTGAAGSAEYHQWGLWKGASLAVLTLRDGSQRRARFSYYGGFFGLEGVSGIYNIRGGQDSEFFKTFQSIMREQFIPKRPKT
jgi:hypothetical protein